MDRCSEVDEYVSSRIRKSRYLVRKGKMFIKNEATVTSRVYCIK